MCACEGGWVVAVEEGLRQAVALHLDVPVRTVERRDLFPKTAVEDAVLDGDDEAMLFLEAREERLVQPREVERVHDGGVDAIARELLCCRRSERGKVPHADECDLRALRDDDGAMERAVVRADGIGALRIAAERRADHDGMLRLRDCPAQDGEVLLDARRCEKDEVRNMGENRDVIEPEMRHIGRAIERRPRHEKDRRAAVDADVLRHLIVRALIERAVCTKDGARPAACEPRRHRDGVLLGDAHIDVLRTEFCTLSGREPDAADDARREIDKIRIPLCLGQNEIDRCGKARVGGRRMLDCTALRVERRMTMPVLGIVLGKGEPLTLLRVNVDDDGLLAVLYRSERRDQRLGIVPIRDVAVVEPHRAEKIVRCRPVRLAQTAEHRVHAAVVLGDRPVIVVEDDDEVRPHLARDIQPLQCLTARERTVADEGDDVLPAPREITCLREPRREADRGRGVPDVKVVVRALLRIRKA